MQLKELAGNEDLFNAMKRLERQQKRAARKMEEESSGGKAAAVAAAPANVFDFINTKLGGKKGRVRDVGIVVFFSCFFCFVFFPSVSSEMSASFPFFSFFFLI